MHCCIHTHTCTYVYTCTRAHMHTHAHICTNTSTLLIAVSLFRSLSLSRNTYTHIHTHTHTHKERSRRWCSRHDPMPQQSITPQRTATRCNTHCNIVHHTATCYKILLHYSVTATLHHTATHTAVLFVSLAFYPSPTHCNSLQHPAVHRNTPQDTATRMHKDKSATRVQQMCA